MTKMETIMSNIMIFIRPIGNHTMRKRTMNIMIHTNMTILMMILKTEKINSMKNILIGILILNTLIRIKNIVLMVKGFQMSRRIITTTIKTKI